MSAVGFPFLTELDTRASIKGSRDPLGLQGIWTNFGRHVVGNLTTVSNSVRDFRTTILGYYFAEIVAADERHGSELGTFLKWEQLVGYARWKAKDRAFRGTERVAKVFNDGDPVTISSDRAHHILGNQKIYGLWGLYTVASRTSGMLLAEDPPRLSLSAREFVEKHYLPRLPSKWILQVLRSNRTRVEWDGRDEAAFSELSGCVARALTAAEKEFYREHLVFGGPEDDTRGRQKQLAELLMEHEADFEWSPQLFRAISKAAGRRGTAFEPLVNRIERIRVCESVIAPMSLMFSFLLGLDGCLKQVAIDRLRGRWRKGLKTIDAEAFSELRAEIGGADVETGERWVRIAGAAADGNYSELIDLALQQNGAVMKARGGAAWCTIENGRFVVKFRDEEGDPPTAEEVQTLWRFPYFIDSLRTVALEVGV